MGDLERRSKVRTTIVIILVILLIAGVSGVGVVGLLSSQRASNERSASTSLKTLASAEADFRANDRDWNHVNDFWTADVKGLYTLTSAAEAGARPNNPKDPSITLIELAVAAADGDESFFAAGGENVPLSAFATPKARTGYWYLTLLTDRTLGESLEMTYRLDTGGKPSMGSVHNTSKFGFTAFPDSGRESGYVFIVNENNTIFRFPAGGVRRGKAVPPGRNGACAEVQHWPDDRALVGDPPYLYHVCPDGGHQD